MSMKTSTLSMKMLTNLKIIHKAISKNTINK